MATSKNQTSETVSPQSQRIIIGAVIAVLVITLLIFLGPRVIQGPFAGKATQYGTPVAETTQGQWGVLISDASAGAPWTGSNGNVRRDEVDATVFVNFGSAGASFSTLRLRLNYDPAVLEPVSVAPIDQDQKYRSDLGSNIDTSNNYVLGYYTWSGSASELQTYRMRDQQSLFRVRFRVIAPDPGSGSNQVYAQAVLLQSVSAEVLNNNAGTSYGVYSTASGNENVQMIAAIPIPASLALTVYPGCYDDDGDGYAPVGRDKQACGPSFQIDDCNDVNAQVRPGGTEVCNAIDDDCDAQTDEELPLEFNTLPEGANRLQGVCLGYQSCTLSGTWVNSYEQVASSYDSTTDVCDFFDNDCDGQLNENAAGSCAIGGAAVSPNIGTVTAQTAGNVFIDYADAGGLASPQLMTLQDRLLYNLIYAARSSECGRAGRESCTATFSPGITVQFCKNNLYYLVEGDVVTKYDPVSNTPATVDNVGVCS